MSLNRVKNFRNKEPETLYAKLKHPKITVVSFEPSKSNFKRGRKVVKKQNN
tara:strand:- start:226 stop:378 length:153 start_codon:yes stop_codon:yes gene_type:complete